MITGQRKTSNGPPQSQAELSFARLTVTLIVGVGFLLAAGAVLVWGESTADISVAVRNSPDLTHEDLSGARFLGTYTNSLTFRRSAKDDFLSGNYAIIDRKVQTCAWIEVQKKTKKGPKTLYKKAWADEVPNSTSFETKGYDNKAGPVQNALSIGKGFKVGAYALSTVSSFHNLDTIAPQTGQVIGARLIQGYWAYFASDTSCGEGGGAMVGDQRMRFKVIRNSEQATVFGLLQSNRISPYRNDLLLTRGTRKALISEIKEEGKAEAWIYRLLGAFLLWIAFYLFISSGLKLLSDVPIVGALLASAAATISTVTALIVTCAFIFLGWGMTFFTRLFAGLIG